MNLLLGQLVYTSFARVGFRTLASAQVTREVQQAFMQSVVFRHWDAYRIPKVGYRAAYLQQLTPETTLFGWLYDDGADDMERAHVPYFICYCLAEPLYPFHLESIFTCLQKGPVAVINRHTFPSSLETKVVSDLWSYYPARSGVVIPASVRKSQHAASAQGELLDVFVTVEEQEMVVEPHSQTYEQQKASLSIYSRCCIEGISTDDVAIDDYSAVMGQTRVAVQEAPVPLNQTTEINQAQTDAPLGTVTATVPSTIPSAIKRKANYKSVLAYKNSQLLLKAGIAATVLALTSSIYGLLQTSNLAPIARNTSLASTSNPIFYQTLAQVANVPQGEFVYGGSTTFAPLRSTAIVAAINQAHPQFKLRFASSAGTKPGSALGIKMLLAGEMSFAQSSHPIKDRELDAAKQLGFTLEAIPVALDGIAFYVNPQVSIPGLSISQVKDIFTGKITNWKAVGGPDLLITAFSRNYQTSGTAKMLQEQGLLGDSSSLQEVKTTTESIRKVAVTPGGIGYATASEVIGQDSVQPVPLAQVGVFVSPFKGDKADEVNTTAFANGSYPLTRQLFVVVKRDGGLDEQAGVAYANLLLTDEGQRLVEKAGFARLR